MWYKKLPSEHVDALVLICHVIQICWQRIKWYRYMVRSYDRIIRPQIALNRWNDLPIRFDVTWFILGIKFKFRDLRTRSCKKTNLPCYILLVWFSFKQESLFILNFQIYQIGSWFLYRFEICFVENNVLVEM